LLGFSNSQINVAMTFAADGRIPSIGPDKPGRASCGNPTKLPGF
jgi:hypothetical protein